MKLKQKKNYKQIIEQTLHNYDYCKLIFTDERKARDPKCVVTHDMGECLICGSVTGSGCYKVCDKCLEKYEHRFK